MENDPIYEPIEGFFIQSREGLIFDVKEISQPADRVIAFVRYVPSDNIKLNNKARKGFVKLYDLKDRYHYLEEHFPKYLFKDPKGKGLLQAVARSEITEIFDPRKKMKSLLLEDHQINSLEYLTSLLARKIVEYSGIELNSIGISGSILVNLHTENSDIDLIIYGEKNGLAVYNKMSEIFDNVDEINRYSKNELQELWKDRGQEKQIVFNQFRKLEENKQLQGKIINADFYIRCVPYPSERQETYDNTRFDYAGEMEVICTIAESSKSIYTPCIYLVKDVIVQNKPKKAILPNRIFSYRGRYCDLAKEGEKVHVKGKLELVSIANEAPFYQIILGTTADEFFIKK